MWCRILLLSVSVYLFASCTHHRLLTEQHNQYDVKLTIRAANDVVFDTVKIIVSFENRSANDIYLLDSGWVNLSSYPLLSGWRLNLLFRDSISMSPPILYRLAESSKEDYILLKSGEIYTFNFDVVFSELMMGEWCLIPLQQLRSLNNGYGEYSMKLIYQDRDIRNIYPIINYPGCKKAFRGTVESNEIRILNCEK